MFFFCRKGFYRDHQWSFESDNSGKVSDMRGGVEGILQKDAQIVSDPDLGRVVSLNASEAWILMEDLKGTKELSFSESARWNISKSIIHAISPTSQFGIITW